MIGVTAGAVAANVQLTLKIAYRNKDPGKEERASLFCQVILTNRSQDSVTLQIPDRDPPFRLSIVDHFGQDLLQQFYERQRKDGKAADETQRRGTVTVNLQPNDSKRFELTIFIGKGKTEDDVAVDITPGLYEIQARLASVEYIESQYKTTVFESNIEDVKIL